MKSVIAAAHFKSAMASRVGISILALAGLAVSGNASIIPVLVSGPTPDGSNFAYSYSANLQQDERLDPNATNGVTCQGIGGLVQCNPAGTFFTLYDVEGFVSADTSASGWFANVQLTGITPSSVLGNGFDDPNTLNVTFFYTGPVVIADGSVDRIAGFQIVSSIDGLTMGAFTSQATKNAPPGDGSTDQTVGPVALPGTDLGTLGGPAPEPATYSLVAGAGLVLFGIRRFRRQIK